jgi:translation initiation factor 2 subunit 3
MEHISLNKVVAGQAIFNIGTAGHVAHGKSTIVKRITGVATQTHKDEKEKNITIRLGYANCKLYRNKKGIIIPFPEETVRAYDPDTSEPLDLLYQVSFVDCPGHQAYISTMISGSFIMDYVLVVIDATAPIPQPQTHEHLLALDYSGIPAEKMCFVLNKMDLAKDDGLSIRKSLQTYLDTSFGECPQRVIIPVSAATGANINVLVNFISEQVRTRLPKTIAQAEKNLRMLVVRSYNINRPNAGLDLQGAVLGGTIQSGVITNGDYIEIRPGVINMSNGQKVVQPLAARVINLQSGKNAPIELAIPGGLVGVNLSLYAGLSGDNKLKGQVITHLGYGDPIYNVVGGRFRGATGLSDQAQTKLNGLVEGSTVSIIVDGIMNAKGTVSSLKIRSGDGSGDGEPGAKSVTKGTIIVTLAQPVVLRENEPNYIAVQVDGYLVAGLQADLKKCKMTMPVIVPKVPQEDGILWHPKKYNIIDDLHDDPTRKPVSDLVTDPDNYEKLLAKIKTTDKAVKAQFPMPEANIINMTTYVSGMKKFVHAMGHKGSSTPTNKPVDMERVIMDNMNTALPGCKPRYNKDGALVLDGRWNQRQLGVFIREFIDTIIKCPSCKSEVSVIEKDTKSKLTIRKCTICGSDTYIDSLTLH